MLIRDTQHGELEQIRANSPNEYDKLDPPDDAEEAITMLDDEGIPRLVMKAQRVAEVYLAIDHRWQTPAMRWAMIEAAHAGNEAEAFQEKVTMWRIHFLLTGFQTAISAG